MSTATVLNSAGVGFTVTNTVLNSSGTAFDVDNDVLNSAGAAFTIFASTEIEEDSGGTSVSYGLSLTAELRRDEEIVMQFAREYMKRVH